MRKQLPVGLTYVPPKEGTYYIKCTLCEFPASSVAESIAVDDYADTLRNLGWEIFRNLTENKIAGICPECKYGILKQAIEEKQNANLEG